MSASKASDLVTFNVGGKIYQVLREPTLSLHPNSLLTQMAEDQKDDKPIFVEGNQDLFQFVIDFHRDRKVHLPITISKEAVLRELKRFGLEATDEQIVQDGVCLTSVKRKLGSWEETNRTQRNKMNAELAGSFLAEAAAKVVLEREKGQGFKVSANDLDKIGITGQDAIFQRILSGVQNSCLENSESLKAFASSFGYKMTVSSFGTRSLHKHLFVEGQGAVIFTPALPKDIPLS